MLKGRADRATLRLGRPADRPTAQIAQDLGVNEGTLNNWVVQVRAPATQDALKHRWA
ncbi:MAG: hypothetical protein ACP5H2_02415 [Solirubrobacteraceae bacterium]